MTLDYLHSQSIFHRDVKLDNVLIQPLDSQPVPQLKLVDFGLSMEGRLANTNVVRGQALQLCCVAGKQFPITCTRAVRSVALQLPAASTLVRHTLVKSCMQL